MNSKTKSKLRSQQLQNVCVWGVNRSYKHPTEVNLKSRLFGWAPIHVRIFGKERRGVLIANPNALLFYCQPRSPPSAGWPDRLWTQSSPKRHKRQTQTGWAFRRALRTLLCFLRKEESWETSRASQMHDLSHFMKPRMLMNVPLVSEARKSKFTSKENIFPKKPPSEKWTTLHEARTHVLSTKILPVELLLYSLHYKKLKSQLLTNGGI